MREIEEREVEWIYEFTKKPIYKKSNLKHMVEKKNKF